MLLLEQMISKQIAKFRLGLYVATLGASRDEYARVEVKPDWCADPLKNVRTVASAILDVEAPSGSTAGVISQDGVASVPLNLGTIYDSNFKLTSQTVWLRAKLQSDPGQLDMGATLGVRISVGSKPENMTTLAPGRISIGNGTAEVVRELHDTVAELSTTLTTINTYLIAITAASVALEAGSGTPVAAVAFAGALKAAVATAQPSVLLSIQSVNALKLKLTTLKE